MSKTEEEWGLHGQAFYRQCLGQKVVLRLMTEKYLIGEVVGLDRHNIVLDPGDDTTLLVPKHAIAYVTL